jgi:ADP-glucose pyrophosphorylase
MHTQKKDEKHILDCFDDDWKFYTLSAQTTPEKFLKKQRN